MLRMYLDESGFDGRSPVYVLAGVISTTEKWAAFSDEWKQILEMPNPIRISAFHAADAMQFKGEFYGCSVESRDEKIRNLDRVFCDHVIASAAVVMPVAAYQSVIKRPWAEYHFGSPYRVMLFRFIKNWMKRHEEFGFGGQEIDFVFDDHVEQDSVRHMWKEFMDYEWLPRRLKRLIANKPMFLNDEKVMPLQVADMMAWLNREKSASEMGGLERTAIKGPIRKVRPQNWLFTMDEKYLEDYRQNMENSSDTLQISTTANVHFDWSWAWFAPVKPRLPSDD